MNLDDLPPVIAGDTITGVQPRDLTPHTPVAVTPPEAVAGVVARAREAQPAWEALGFEGRAKLMKQATKAMLERYEESCALIMAEAGKTRGHALLNEAIGPLDYTSGWIKVARPALKPRKLPINPVAMPGKRAVTELIPRGVVGLIAPWNYPLGVYFKPAIPALLTGNALVIKPSEYAPRTGAWFVERLQEHLPEGVVQVVQGGHEVGRALVDGGIDACSFTGSVRGGRAVMTRCAELMIPCSAELGGADPAIVLADCDLDRTIAGVLNVALQTSGQDCGAIERIYVVEAIADTFVQRLADAASRLNTPSPGDDLDQAACGPLATPPQLRIVQQHIADAVEKGATVLCGGEPSGQGLWLAPTVLDHCTQDMDVIREESFGPVIPVVRVKDAEEAIALANDSTYGLNASLWSRDTARAEKLGRRLQVGTVFINNHGITGAMPFAPWTGVKNSGYGVANSEFSLEAFVRPRTILVDTNKGPDPWWLPADDSMSRMGELLAAAQLGKLLEAIQLLSVMSERKKRIMDFVRGK